uniref:AlNc14C5G755 protein n=1 Tax=Albugo laibachii Nc14 TaxID=890382 RepID=F0W0X5_9STRA|nr:AlNc14C5G755 [Albugo laibachii Nc14]|eukprot:CCA14699.1 AlNc14C5G755 [Albugo laibachii Nc14]
MRGIKAASETILQAKEITEDFYTAFVWIFHLSRSITYLSSHLTQIVVNGFQIPRFVVLMAGRRWSGQLLI